MIVASIDAFVVEFMTGHGCISVGTLADCYIQSAPLSYVVAACTAHAIHITVTG